MLYEEFAQYKEIKSPYGAFLKAYLNYKGKTFYVEPGFHVGLLVYKDRMEESYPLLLKEIYRLIDEVGEVYFTSNADAIENPFEGYRYLEVEDIANRIGVILADDNRPADYGD